MESSGSSRRVLLIGTDGLRPDQFDPALMPTYAALMAQGTKFTAHHAVFPSYTRAIISAIVTGCTPGKHGIVSSNFRAEGATPDHTIHTDKADELEALDRLTDGQAIMKPTLGDILERHGVGMGVAGAQTSGGGALWARHQEFPKIIASTTYGRAENQELWNRLGGDPPAMASPDRIHQDRYVARGVADIFLDDDSLRLITLWLAEPDYSLHRHGLGSAQVREAVQACDDSLAYILDGMDKRGIRDQFNILLISDHGHSTVHAQGTLGDHLARARQELGDRMPELTAIGDNIYPEVGAKPPTAADLVPVVEWLQHQPWVGAILGGTPDIARLPGVMSLADVWNGTINERAPLLAISPSWTPDANEAGVPGTVNALVAEGKTVSTHGTGSPFEMHAIAYGIGPDFHEGGTSGIPSGATDLAPTILSLLGIDVPDHMDGRVLWEAMREPSCEIAGHSDYEIEPAETAANGFRPRIRLHRVGHTTYVHEVVNGR